MLATLLDHPYATAASVLATYLVSVFFYNLYIHRTRIAGLPQPPGHSYIWGHLKTMGDLYKDMPRNLAPQGLFYRMLEKHQMGDIFYLDLWPTSDPILIIADTDMFNQVAVKPSMPKHRAIGDFLGPLSDVDENLVTAEGADWKTWRAAFNPGFSSQHLQTFVPLIVEEVQVFARLLENHARKNEPFRMESATTRLTVDIIARVILDERLNSQTSDHPLFSAFSRQVKILPLGPFFNPIELIDFTRPFRRWRNRRIMDEYINKILDDRFATRHQREKKKLVVDLALEYYLKEEKKMSNANAHQAKTLDPTFKKAATNHIKTFLFAGHDTTSSAICYAYHLLSKSPESLAKLRAELDNVLGTGSDAAARSISENPSILNQLPYTLAVIKETLRCYPAASTLREGKKGHFIHDPKTGRAYPTDACMIYPLDVAYHRHPSYWGPDVHTFRPERFLSPSSSSSSSLQDDTANPIPNKEAFVPFSRGPRNCIGQDLALIEAKIILALTIREFDFRAAYDELSKLKGDGTGYPCDEKGPQSQFGDEAYQIQLGTAKPREGWPCRVTLRKK